MLTVVSSHEYNLVPSKENYKHIISLECYLETLADAKLWNISVEREIPSFYIIYQYTLFKNYDDNIKFDL